MILLVNLISGALGANIAAGLFRRTGIGFFSNSLIGVLGGGVGGEALAALGFQGLAVSTASRDGLDTVALLGQAGSAGVCGAIALLLAGLLRNLVAR